MFKTASYFLCHVWHDIRHTLLISFDNKFKHLKDGYWGFYLKKEIMIWTFRKIAEFSSGSGDSKSASNSRVDHSHLAFLMLSCTHQLENQAMETKISF